MSFGAERLWPPSDVSYFGVRIREAQRQQLSPGAVLSWQPGNVVFEGRLEKPNGERDCVSAPSIVRVNTRGAHATPLALLRKLTRPCSPIG